MLEFKWLLFASLYSPIYREIVVWYLHFTLFSLFLFFSCVVSIYQAVTLPKKRKVCIMIHFCTPTKHFNFKFPLPFKVKLTKKIHFLLRVLIINQKHSLSESLSVAGFTYNANTLLCSFRLTKDRCVEEEENASFNPSFHFSLSEQLLPAHMTRHVIYSTATPTTLSVALTLPHATHSLSIWLSKVHNTLSYGQKQSWNAGLNKFTIHRPVGGWGVSLLC